jgi:hypothetical protein
MHCSCNERPPPGRRDIFSPGARSGQLNVVVEFPFTPSLSLLGGSNPSRWYLAEGVAAVVEVKSNIAAQWQQALDTAAKLAPLKRTYGMNMSFGNKVPIDRIVSGADTAGARRSHHF